MAVKLSARERAKIRLGDFDYSEAMLREMTKKIEAEDAELAGDPPRQKETLPYMGKDMEEMAEALSRALIERDGNDDALYARSSKKDKDQPRTIEQARASITTIEKLEAEGQQRLFPAPLRRGGVRAGAGRKKGEKPPLKVLSIRVTDEERAALLSLFDKLRKKRKH